MTSHPWSPYGLNDGVGRSALRRVGIVAAEELVRLTFSLWQEGDLLLCGGQMFAVLRETAAYQMHARRSLWSGSSFSTDDFAHRLRDPESGHSAPLRVIHALNAGCLLVGTRHVIFMQGSVGPRDLAQLEDEIGLLPELPD